MQEKDMVTDSLTMINSGLATYASVISQCENQQLRQTIQQIRNNDENSQYELFQLAKQRNYYKPAHKANPQAINQVLTDLTTSNMG